MKYNINELLEKKKEIETQIRDFATEITALSLTYKKDVYTDLASKEEKVYEDKKKLSLNEYTQKFNGLVEELAKIKTAISKFNAEFTAELLYKREKARNTFMCLNSIKNHLPTNDEKGRKVTRTNNEGIALEMYDFEKVPMFAMNELENRINETAAEERKLNTKIQLLNLQAEIEL